MNTIKYINPSTGQVAFISVAPLSRPRYKAWGSSPKPTPAQADYLMYRKGFERAGLRRSRPSARRAFLAAIQMIRLKLAERLKR